MPKPLTMWTTQLSYKNLIDLGRYLYAGLVLSYPRGNNAVQRVKFSQFVSDWLTLNGGMPQGFYLGPLIFLALINGLTAGSLAQIC